MSNHGRIWWSELNTWNADKAKQYYGSVMGWDFQETPTAGTDSPRPYYIAMKNGQPVAGIFTLVKPMFDGVPDHWFTYIAVENIEQAIASGREQGGSVRREPFDIPGAGTIAVIADKNGAAFGVIQPNDDLGDS